MGGELVRTTDRFFAGVIAVMIAAVKKKEVAFRHCIGFFQPIERICMGRQIGQTEPSDAASPLSAPQPLVVFHRRKKEPLAARVSWSIF